jgi:hypothetical protein
MKATSTLHDLGQSLWLDNITRNLLTNGTLQGYIDTLAPSLIWRSEARTSPSIRPKTCAGPLQNSHLGDFIEDKNAILPIDAVIQSSLRETTSRVLASVTPREERVSLAGYGCDDLYLVGILR